MSRAPERAGRIAFFALVGWLTFVCASLIVRHVDAHNAPEVKHRAARFFALLASQVAIQQGLVFPLPFFARAVSSPIHAPFALLYAAALAVGLWDPWFAWFARRAWLLFVLQAFAAFVGLAVALPMLGMSNEAAFIAAGATVAVGVPVATWIAHPAESARYKVVFLADALAVGIACVLGAPLVPPAPLRLVDASVGTRLEGRDLSDPGASFPPGAALLCHTSIAAPLGIKDRLVHVWRHNGVEVQRVHLRMQGGRDAGFRTWSRFSGAHAGVISCTVETSLGQVLGSAVVTVRAH